MFALAASPASARPAEIGRAIPDAQQVGAARYQMLALTLFEAELWSPTGAFSWQQPFALSLTYRRSFSARAITGRALTEMTQRGGGTLQSLAPLRAPLEACFANVSAGDRITGVSTGANTARFYFNGAQTCELEWPGLRRTFFGIWLDGRSQPQFSARLRGDV